MPHHTNHNHIKTIITGVLFFLFVFNAGAQTYLYFQDSPTPSSYDYSWMELTAPSELERTGSDLRKFPVENTLPPAQGTNCLKLKWKSVSGGDWVAIAAGLNWTAKNLSQTDTLLFWLQSDELLDSVALPRIFMEDVNNTKTTKHFFGRWCVSLQAGFWQKVSIPMEMFLNQGDAVDFTQIKTIGFAQNVADGQQHTLYVDDMRAFEGSGISPPVSAPANLTAKGYDSHVELRWDPNPESYLNGYQVQRSTNNGSVWETVGVVSKSTTQYLDWVRSLGTAVEADYRIMALNSANEPSPPSDTASAQTTVFTDEQLLNMVQEYTFRYFWDFAHPASGMARERNSSGNTVTSGGSGFGIMALPVGVERGFITREQGVERMQKILTFLETADRFHGVWPHWINGNTGQVIPFSTNDNGGDLVETGFLVQGLLTVRQYFNQDNPEEQDIVQRITALWESVEWDWYTRDNSGALYWHWSPTVSWQMNMKIRGWNEGSIIYMLAIASPTHGIPASYWENGWAANPNYTNGKSFYGYKLDVGWDNGGPLFFAHYSFLGFDPRNIKDQFTNYFNLNRNHTLINRAYCIDNPLNHAGYGENCWGLTASDDPFGYMAHEPTNDRDNGTISPTAALSSMPYTPEESLAALKHFYRELGDKTWSEMGFYDAFNQRENWWATSTLAIDQGPIVVMIENARTGLLWENFMANPEIAPMLEQIGFGFDPYGITENDENPFELKIHPNPSRNETVKVTFYLPSTGEVQYRISNLLGMPVVNYGKSFKANAGTNEIIIQATDLPSGLYLLTLLYNNHIAETVKLMIN
ncbi:MAG: glucoamylase family protein [Lentimicrobium sp.]|jgi:hypothetical protein|nr:glucoamylase family protein [Lentimicrobium sp.]